MNLQPTYASGVAVAIAGMIASEEKANKVSRTVESAAGIAFGQPAFRGANDHGVVAGGAFAATGAGSVDGTNVGTTTITGAPAVNNPAMAGRYTITQMSAGATGVVQISRPDGTVIGDGVIGTPFTIDGIGPVTLTAGGAPAVGDRFYVDVTYTANARYLGLAVYNPAVPATAGAPDAYPQYFTGAFMTMGPMWVPAGASFIPGAAAYWDPATKLYTADVTKVRIPNARFDTTGVNGGLALLLSRLRDA